MKVVLSNAILPSNGVASIPLPIPKTGYDQCILTLAALDIGDALKADCKVEEISGEYPLLQRLKGTCVNVDELDYLVKRLESFDKSELAQFSALAVTQDIYKAADFINLTFCFQSYPIVQDFANLERIGQHCFMDRNGGTMSLEDEQHIDFKKVALNLLQNENGKVTPYGVIYDEGFQMERLYDGRHFPQYRYEDCVMEVEVTSAEVQNPLFVCLPLSELQLERAMQRGECHVTEGIQLRFLESNLPEEADAAIHFEQTSIARLNDLCQAVSTFSKDDLAKLGAVAALAKPSDAAELSHLAEQLDLFDFIPGIGTAKEYGKHMICESGHFEYDGNLEGYYNFEKYGAQRMEQELGGFNHRGYVSYHGFVSMDELLAGVECERMGMTMGGM